MPTHVMGRRVVVVLTLGASVVVALVVTLLLLGGHETASALNRPVMRPSKQVLRRYAIFARRARSNDVMPMAYLLGPEEHAEAVTRKPTTTNAAAAANTNYTQWATAEGDELCTTIRYTPPGSVEPDTNEDCNTAGYLEAHHELIAGASLIGGKSSTPPEPGLVNVIHGLAPNGVGAVTFTFADGTEATVPVTENTFIYSLAHPEKLLRTTWVEASGYHGAE